MDHSPGKPLRILILEDEPDDAELVERTLRKAGLPFTAVRAENRAQFLAAIEGQGADFLLADFSLPDMTGLDALQILRERGLDLPTILVTGSQGEEVAVACIRAGAFDYILKDRMERLPTAVTRALEHHNTQREKACAVSALERSELRYRQLFEGNLAGVYRSTPDGRLLEANEALARIYGFDSPQEMLGQNAHSLYPSPEHREAFLTTLRENKTLVNIETEGLRKDGERIRLLENVAWIEDPVIGAPVIEGTIFDITKRKRAEEALRQAYLTQSLIDEILKASLESAEVTPFLQRVLDRVVSIPWLRIESKGAIFLSRGPSGTLSMVAKTGLSPYILEACATVTPGRCLCGRAAQSGQTLFAGHLDANHETHYEGIRPHGHFCVPILSGAEVLGVMCIYVKDGHEERHYERVVLEAVAGILGGFIQRQRSRESLQESETRFRSLIQAAPEGIFVQSEGRFVFLNPSALRLFGAKAEEDMLGMDLMARIAPEYHEAVRGRIRMQGETGRPAPLMTQEYVRLDGSRVPVETTAVAIRFQGRDAHLVFVRDITDRRLAEEALENSERLFREFFESNPAASYMAGASGEILSCNEAFRGLFGFHDREEALSFSMERLYEDPSARGGLHDSLRERRSVSLRESRFRSPSGKTIVALETAAGIFDAGGCLTGVIGFLLDLTAFQEMKAQFLQSQKMELVGRLAGGIAHDFNNLLTTILTFTELAAERIEAASPARRNIEQVQAAAQRAAGLTRQLLAYSRQQVFEMETMDMKAALDGTLKLFSRSLGEKIRVEVEAEDGLRPIRGNQGQVEQVIMNLVVNAGDAMETGGTLTIRLFNGPEEKRPEDAVPGAGGGPSVVLDVSDTGFGMGPEVMARIFDPYFTTKGREKGTGLGLAVVEGIVKQHGGTIEVTSAPGAGTSFHLCFPAEMGPVPPSRQDAPRPLRKTAETILLVEDEEGVREAARQALESLGYRVLTAHDAADAVRVFEGFGEPIHLVLSDMMMPGSISGGKLCEDLKRSHPGLATLLMSGHADDILLREGISSGEVAFIQKPFTRQSLAAKIREILDS